MTNKNGEKEFFMKRKKTSVVKACQDWRFRRHRQPKQQQLDRHPSNLKRSLYHHSNDDKQNTFDCRLKVMHPVHHVLPMDRYPYRHHWEQLV